MIGLANICFLHDVTLWYNYPIRVILVVSNKLKISHMWIYAPLTPLESLDQQYVYTAVYPVIW